METWRLGQAIIFLARLQTLDVAEPGSKFKCMCGHSYNHCAHA